MRAWFNGRIVQADDAALTVIDHGITVGDGVFETVKVVDGQPFAMTRHLKRLRASAVGLGLPAPDLDEVRAAAADVLSETPGLGKLRITYTDGPGPLGSPRDHVRSTLIVIAEAMGEPSPTTVAITVPWTRNENSAVAGLKTTSYAENVRAVMFAVEHGGTEAIFANTAGQLCEGTGSNVFCVFGDELATPPLSSGCLAGVTRQLVIDWCGATERDITMDEFASADEVFLVSTTRDVQAVSRLDEREWAEVGPVTRSVQQVWTERSAKDVDP